VPETTKLEQLLNRLNLDQVQRELLAASLFNLSNDRITFASAHLSAALASIDELRNYVQVNFSDNVRPLNEILALIAEAQQSVGKGLEGYRALSEATYVSLRTAEDGPLDDEHVRALVPLLGQLSISIRRAARTCEIKSDITIFSICNFRCLASINILSRRTNRYNSKSDWQYRADVASCLLCPHVWFGKLFI